MTDKVWTASKGQYSDYVVECAFTTEAAAVAYCAHRNGVTPEVQREWHTLPWEDGSRPYEMMYVETLDLFTEPPVLMDKVLVCPANRYEYPDGYGAEPVRVEGWTWRLAGYGDGAIEYGDFYGTKEAAVAAAEEANPGVPVEAFDDFHEARDEADRIREGCTAP